MIQATSGGTPPPPPHTHPNVTRPPSPDQTGTASRNPVVSDRGPGTCAGALLLAALTPTHALTRHHRGLSRLRHAGLLSNRPMALPSAGRALRSTAIGERFFKVTVLLSGTGQTHNTPARTVIRTRPRDGQSHQTLPHTPTIESRHEHSMRGGESTSSREGAREPCFQERSA